MEIFCRNIPEQVQEKHLRKELKPILGQFQIHVFDFQKVGRKNGKITVADARKGQRFLDTYESRIKPMRGPPKPSRPPITLRLFGFPVQVCKSTNTPYLQLLQSLREEEEAQLNARFAPAPSSIIGEFARVRHFKVTMMSCGSWEYRENRPVFVEYFRLPYGGVINLGKTAFEATFTDFHTTTKYSMEIPYWNVADDIYVGAYAKPSVAITTGVAPRFYISDPIEQMKAQMAALFQKSGRRPPSKRRVGHLLPSHEKVSARCFTYRFALQDPRDTGVVRKLAHDRNVPKMSTWNDWCVSPRKAYNILDREFEVYLRRMPFDYRVNFQLQKLVWNGDLSLNQASLLFPTVHRLHRQHTPDIVAQALIRLGQNQLYPSPGVLASDVGIETIVEALEKSIDAIVTAGSEWEINLIPEKSVLVHRAMVTPCGIYLSGPYTETKNRILRKYLDNIDYFIRVEFLDETGDPVFFDPSANLESIFHQRFAGVMKRGIEIAGRVFEYLGFSHSSLRSQTCWFAAPFTTANGDYLDAKTIIGNIGHFDHIRSPSKQAARIGQAFSDTLTSISVSKEVVKMKAPDVKRNGRVFSDGVGVISRELMYRIWNEYALRERVKPTVFQIRIAGAKGMVSLDTRKKGEFLMLRESMVKFPTDDLYNIEICGAGIRALPFYLNNQIIKILEDLGVPFEAFHQLQQDEISFLYSTFSSIERAANFLEESPVPRSLRLPWLLLVLKSLGIRYSQDPFLQRVMELTMLLRLRDLKYRARIRVPNAVTLYGIMDETGYLKENEIYCVYLAENGRREILVRDNVVITRSPALHPGDVQVANAVDVPANSPLRKLHNCVAFSQFGTRDLPSMLSGGDLDGDLYNIIYDTRLLPQKTFSPADYPRAEAKELDRKVETEDIIDFFVTFMQQDQLGRIAITHQAIADQSERGTLDGVCLTLARLHSTAVDYSKSGIAVDVMSIPKAPRVRPDFMAPSPRIRVEDSIESILREKESTVQDDDDDDNDRAKIRYYKSHNILGRLYRSIDEQSFLHQLRDAGAVDNNNRNSVLKSIWRYVESEVDGFLWNHLTGICHDIKDIYEDKLRELLHKYSSTPLKSSISEYELFVGTILGHGHKQRRRDKENANEMRDEYNRLVEFTISMIRDTESGGTEALERSIACFWVAINEQSAGQKAGLRSAHTHQEKLLSFPWIAAMTCLDEVDKFQRYAPI
ncbi:RNA-dependent RNA polymerase 1 [Nannizzia gypsea CBS 118893]|uniref:RNA-dependent RNA polymerase n=1 Tax=Arthroderma gypseum (strain ATCC MYA-4604 / CBS 118893) TaxID=535722 RepID=E4UZH6_ARTGP|nr:RNA-dependent RNA polymerase 1 [Nannizzia gypsea CBS 118893]EFR03506.1 RNA-dependent RNA polymerase 1 [Nannizzia gypsea CBS 118893]